MTLEQALNAWLTELTGLDCFWLERPEQADNAVVYRCISPGFIAGNLRRSGIRDDSYSITLYHQNPDVGKQLADQIAIQLEHFTGVLNPETDNEYTIQLASFSGGFDQRLEGENGANGYQFNRDFVINH